MNKFNVLLYDFNTRQIEIYDVMPYFRSAWKEEKKKPKTKKELKQWIKDESRYMFWARCQYEIMIGPWPYRESTLEKDLIKVDIHQQLMMNLDILTEFLYKEFGQPINRI